MTSITSMPGGIKSLLNDLVGLAEFLKTLEGIESIDQARAEAIAAHERQLQIVEEAKRNATILINDVRNRADIEMKTIEDAMSDLRAKFDSVNEQFQVKLGEKVQLDGAIALGQSKLDAIKLELANIAGKLS